MIYAAYLVFWFFIPLLCIYFRIRKRITTGFTLGIVLTSIFLGFITVNTFEEKNEERFVRLINERKVSKAKTVLRWILQRDPRDVQKIDISRIRDREAFQRMKQELADNYLSIIQTTLNKVKVPGKSDCDDIDNLKSDVKRMRNGLRLLAMVEVLVGSRVDIRDKLQNGIIRHTEVVARLERECR